jgi:hypothetical protein
MTEQTRQGQEENPSKPIGYHSFLLRLWAEGAPLVWRFSLEDPHTGERHGFANWDKLQEFLKEAMDKAKPNHSVR